MLSLSWAMISLVFHVYAQCCWKSLEMDYHACQLLHADKVTTFPGGKGNVCLSVSLSLSLSLLVSRRLQYSDVSGTLVKRLATYPNRMFTHIRAFTRTPLIFSLSLSISLPGQLPRIFGTLFFTPWSLHALAAFTPLRIMKNSWLGETVGRELAFQILWEAALA